MGYDNVTLDKSSFFYIYKVLLYSVNCLFLFVVATRYYKWFL